MRSRGHSLSETWKSVRQWPSLQLEMSEMWQNTRNAMKAQLMRDCEHCVGFVWCFGSFFFLVVTLGCAGPPTGWCGCGGWRSRRGRWARRASPSPRAAVRADRSPRSRRSSCSCRCSRPRPVETIRQNQTVTQQCFLTCSRCVPLEVTAGPPTARVGLSQRTAAVEKCCPFHNAKQGPFHCLTRSQQPTFVSFFLLEIWSPVKQVSSLCSLKP